MRGRNGLPAGSWIVRAAPPPWLFGLTNLPGGVGASFITVTMPFLLRKAGVSLPQIAAIVALAMMPWSWQFLLAPLIDIGLKRRSWLISSRHRAQLAWWQRSCCRCRTA